MKNRSNDEIADALRGLTSGGQPAPRPQPLQPVAPRQAPPSDPISPGPKPATPRPAKPVLPGAPPAPLRAAMPAAPSPAAVARQPVPTPGVRPDAAALQTQTVYDDDAVIVPAPSPEYLGHVHHGTPKRPPRPRSMTLRQTLLPVQLTAGVLLVVTALLKYAVHPDAPLAAMPTWLVAVLAIAGAVIVIAAALNGLHMGRIHSAEGRLQ